MPFTTHILNRETSWLSFNDRVLQEAGDKTVPLIERMRFLGIFSSNQDEFYRVRVANIYRMISISEHTGALPPTLNPDKVLNEINSIVSEQQQKFGRIYKNLLRELEREKLLLINENQLNATQAHFIKHYFKYTVMPCLMPVMIDKIKNFPYLADKLFYLVVRLRNTGKPEKDRHALIEVPTNLLPRFVALPKSYGNSYFILLEDVIRFCLKDIFYLFNCDSFEAWSIKLIRDAQLEIETDFTGDYKEIIANSLKQRQKGVPVRFSYNAKIPQDILMYLIKRMHLKDEVLTPSGKILNFKDFTDFPDAGHDNLVNEPFETVPHKYLRLDKSIIKAIKVRDSILHFPYQSFDYIINFLREASIDPKVRSIKMTLYRMSKNSHVVNALINAVKNGKEVSVIMELQARFDEESNIFWAKRLEEAGAKVSYGIRGMKVHCKVCLVTRLEKDKEVIYANLGTGNYNGVTAKLYCDHSFFTCDERITSELSKVFKYLEIKKKPGVFKHLLVAPFRIREPLLRFIDQEIQNHKQGLESGIILKVNHITDKAIIEKLYEAGKAGVKIGIIARSTCTLDLGLSENIQAISIVDKFLEHARCFIFRNGGKPRYFISSADLMARNIDHRVEVAFPIYDKDIQKQLQEIIDIQLKDNVKARLLNPEKLNTYKRGTSKTKVRAQIDIYNYLQDEVA